MGSLCVKVVEIRLTDAGGDGRAALLVALGTAVTGDASHAVLAGTLTCCLVTRLPCCSNWMAITCYKRKEENKNIKLDRNPVNNL